MKMLAALNIIIFVIITKTLSQPCDYEYSVKLTDRSYDGVKYMEGEYFVHNETKEERGCICMKKPCVRKCCPHGQDYKLAKKNHCVNSTSREFDFPVKNNNKTIKGFNVMEKFHFLYGKMECDSKMNEKRSYSFYEDLYMFTDGKLYVDGRDPVFIYGPDKYCIDTFVSDGESPQLNALTCIVPKPEEKNNYGLSSSCMLVSCFFILLTVAVYAWLPELRNLHGMVLMAYLSSFFVGFLFLASMQILGEDVTTDICITFSFIVYFSLLSAFFWLNVMCYDIWWTFNGKRAQERAGSPHKRFLYYSMYAFGVPSALTILMAALEFSDLPRQHLLLPKLRLQGCFLYGNSKLLYLYGPIVILCVANMIFFTLTAFKIWKIKKETEMLRAIDSSTHDQDRNDTQRFGLYVKLFTVMGINWILEVVSSFYPDANFFWQFSDAYNLLVGLIIFIIFVCKKKTFQMIKNRYRILRGLPLSRTQTTYSTSTRTLSTKSRDELQMNSISK